MRAPLGSRYRRLWIASTASNLADGVVRVGLPLVALQFTRSPTLVAGVTVALTLPWLLGVLPAGAIADRADRRRLMIGAAIARAAVLATVGMLALTGHAELAWLYAAALVLGSAETVFDTTSQSILPDLVDHDVLDRANGRLYAAQVVMNEFAGAPLAGLLVGISVAAAVLTPAGLYILAAAGLLALTGSFRPARRSTRRLDQDVVEGLRYLWAHSLLRRLAVMVAISNLTSAAAMSVLVLHVVAPGPVGLSGFGFGLLIAVLAAGSVTGSLIAEPLQRRTGRTRLLLAGVLGNALVVGGPYLTTEAVLIAAAFFVGGATNMWWNIITVSLRQRIVPAHLLGRINASYRLLAWGTLPLGAALGGLIGELTSVRTVFALAAAVSLTLLIAFTNINDAAIQQAETRQQG